MDRNKQYQKDILEAIAKIKESTRGLTYEDFIETARQDPSLRYFGTLINITEDRAGGDTLIYYGPKREDES